MLGVFGGTFDPIHMGHVASVREVAQGLGLRSVRVVLCGAPGHRDPPLASAADRWEMLQLALRDEPLLIADDRELRAPGACRTVETLCHMQREYPGERLCLIQGSDSFQDLVTWYQWPRIFELAHLIVMTRPGSPDWTAAPAALWSHARLCQQAELSSGRVGCVYPFSVTPQAISATGLRDLLAHGQSAGPWLAPPVADYIATHALYRAKNRAPVPLQPR